MSEHNRLVLAAAGASICFGLAVALSGPSWSGEEAAPTKIALSAGEAQVALSAGEAQQAAPGGSADDADPDETPDGRIAALEADIAALQAQIAALATRVDDAEEREKGPKTAPLVVANKAGFPIFAVNEEAGGADVRIIGSNGTIVLRTDQEARISLGAGSSKTVLSANAAGPRLELAGDGGKLVAGPEQGGMKLLVSQGSNEAALATSGAGPSVSVQDGKRAAQMGVGRGTTGFGFANYAGNALTASFGDAGNGQNSMRIYPNGGGDPVVQAGYHSSGRPGVSVWEGDNPVVRLEGDGAAGQVQVFRDGKMMSVLGKVDERTGLSLFDGNDAALVSVGGGQGPAVALFRSSDPFFEVQASGGSGELKLGKEGEAGWAMKTETANLVIEGKTKDEAVAMGLATLKGFYVGAGGKPQTFMGRTQDGDPSMAIFGKGGSEFPVVTAGVTKAGQPAVRIRNPAGGKDVAVLTTKDGAQGELTLFDAAGEVAKMSMVGSTGTLALSQAGKPVITLGPTQEKATPALRVYQGGKMGLAAGISSDGLGAVAAFGKDGIGALLEASPAGGGAVSVYSKNAEVASVNSADNPGQGLVVVRQAGTGAALVTLGTGTSGGGNVTAMDPTGAGVFSAGYIGGDGPGTACVNHKGMKCLGVGLTGMEGFH